MDPKTYGAKGDGRQLSDAAITKDSVVLESASAFTQRDVGKEIEIEGAGRGSGLPLVTTIASVTAGKATLTRAAESTVAAKKAIFASDDTKAIQAAIDAANAAYLASGVPQTVRFPIGSYLLSYANGTTQPASTQECCLIQKSGVILDMSAAYIFTMAPVATIVTKEFTTPIAGETIEVANTEGFSEANKKLVLSLANTGNIGPTWTAKTATTFTATQAGEPRTVPVGTIVCQNRNRCMIATPKASVAEDFEFRGGTLDGRTVSAVAGGFPEENQVCIEVWGAKNFEISGMEIKRFAGKCLFIEGDGTTLSNFSIHHNAMHHCYANAIRVSPPATDWSLTDNFIHDSAREQLGGVEALIMSTSLNAKRGRIADNIFDNWGVVDLAGTEMQLQNNVIRVGSISSVPGIRILTLAKSSITGNYVDMSSATTEFQTALINEDTVTDVNISGNTFVGPNFAGGITQLQFTCERLNFSNNVCVATVESQGVRLSSAQFKEVAMTGNMIRLLGGTAQVLFEAPGGTFAGNVITSGRLLVQGADTAITGNSISTIAGATATEAMRVIAPRCTIVGNRIKGANGTNGVVRLSNACKDSVISANVIEATAINADWIQEEPECDRNLIEGNHVLAASTGSDIVVKGANSLARNNHGTNGTDYLSRKTTAADYTIKNVDELTVVTSTAAERTMTLPEAAKVPIGKRFTVKDESGGATAKNIKVVPKTPASEKIDGAELQTINANYGKVVVYSNGANWFTV